MRGNNELIRSQTGSTENTRVNVDFSDERDQFNLYYWHISVVFRVLSFVLFAAFLMYIIITAYKNADQFSYEKFEYIIRNFSLTLEENRDDSVYSIEYNPDANRSYSLFGKGLAVCGNSGISIFSATGRLTCSESFMYKDPKLVSSTKFALVYDHSDDDYSIYNAFSRVYSDRTDGIIRGAAVADNGTYALIVSSDSFNTAVELYDDSFSLINRINKLSYVVDIDINNNYLLIASVSVSEGNAFASEVQVFDYIEQSEVFRATSDNNFPLGCAISEGGYVLVGNNNTVVFGYDGDTISSYDHNGNAPCDFSFNRGETVLLFKNSGFDLNYNAVVLDANGAVEFMTSITSVIYDIDVYNGKLFYLTDGSLKVTDGARVYEFSVEDIKSGTEILSFGDGRAYVCTDTSAPMFVLP